MTLTDAQQVANIEAKVFAHPWSLTDFEREMDSNPLARYLVAENEDEVVGFAGAHIILDEGHITNIAVLENFRGKGIGSALVRELMQYASNLGVRYLTLEVRVSNETAIRMYRSFGFVKMSVRKKYYEDNGEDAWLMVSDAMPPAQDDFREKETLFE